MTIAVVLLGAVMLGIGVWGLLSKRKLPAWWRLSWFATTLIGLVIWLLLVSRAQPVLLPKTSPCYAVGDYGSRLFPPDSYCVHDDGSRRTVNGLTSQVIFWICFVNSTLLYLIGLQHAAVRLWRRGRRLYRR
ncbi:MULTISPECIES: hypothetical protein [unclassified Streptomyces]|uniref:hypothetical protein n=1 Tax=unclassified Streptomyces TaxID=2593676 RepID=UPI00036358AB|nr:MULTISPECIES: hypothetical protein [unclassified Streptomyces]MYT31287.1 hypothetical protein [Streptomyces sp. SID8354]